ncbi:hypothetical protein WN51_03093 [Melipona quadrifasciata]|uniref:Uncharacterized protein n=1 Tax=Melipona quadrifasciata TaxID=166423 RepID=A0A0M8ZWF2_9HYME|nr:hypothetical protein WN51_03093 [Melipona quadrifasciata]
MCNEVVNMCVIINIIISIQIKGQKFIKIMLTPNEKENITEYGYKVIFHKDYAAIRHSDGSVAMKVEMRDGLYFSSIDENSKFAG